MGVPQRLVEVDRDAVDGLDQLLEAEEVDLDVVVDGDAEVLRDGGDQGLAPGGEGGVDLRLAPVGDGDPEVAGEGQQLGLGLVGVDPQDHDRVGEDALVVAGGGVVLVEAGGAVRADQQVVLRLAGVLGGGHRGRRYRDRGAGSAPACRWRSRGRRPGPRVAMTMARLKVMSRRWGHVRRGRLPPFPEPSGEATDARRPSSVGQHRHAEPGRAPEQHGPADGVVAEALVDVVEDLVQGRPAVAVEGERELDAPRSSRLPTATPTRVSPPRSSIRGWASARRPRTVARIGRRVGGGPRQRVGAGGPGEVVEAEAEGHGAADAVGLAHPAG